MSAGGRSISILDYGLGNLRSVEKALLRLGFRARRVRRAGDPAEGPLLLPGVGNFADAMAKLHALSLAEPLKAQAAAGRPILGVCLGMQLLFERSDEDAEGPEGTPGLGLLPGRVVPLSGGVDPRGRRLKVPQMGWNTLRFGRGPRADALAAAARSADPPGSGDPAVYFVHGYHAEPADPADVLATTDHGGAVVAIAGRGNVLGMQFHPEKSQAVGLALLRAAAGLLS
ncbi:imidazole glycerol phosphate synthase subunit HisH [Phycisphaera mikurensis]|uniref:Imidazole glycerol phosphate synthase subunit HisH n=1 Tax=Phycisphaera mikurensis (strain NBRC 102666 / KCTC 22515 / FYK2301M01) TaxID=1142394 RepID=I0IER8_PHYMF|nr:imidazole glycerol phosphate synthase subunit HisH [Phycisphaera mikurensis]MBB6441551.1 glutamine amidotransferase [Phycisphaera mikurensis]BAM03756.1 imidazole glycerol phosphate synthase subunit HisH [Phycisphaera mikurensis NBRC 102666]